MAKNTIKILRGTQMDGYTFALHPKTIAFLESRNIPLHLARISIGFDTKEDFESMHGPLWAHVEELLLGLSIEEIAKLGPVEFIDAKTNKLISAKAN